MSELHPAFLSLDYGSRIGLEAINDSFDAQYVLDSH